MSLDTIYYTWQKTTFFIVHITTIWLLLVLLATALSSWLLASSFDKQNARAREAKLARRTASAYTSIALTLWLISFIFK
ncbi:hypothetical protein SDC9_22911 [bioreactor metagenome]|uniref:Uncharacterized protein n=1 Tax=bioreactor metagenome TaxID=1076179 RepID=A0A644UDW7_9ZZZZ|nr:hypothetical protein [Negativicutes bacterium]